MSLFFEWPLLQTIASTTLGLQLFAGTNFSEFHSSLIWRVLILTDLQSQLLTPIRFVELCIASSDKELDFSHLRRWISNSSTRLVH